MKDISEAISLYGLCCREGTVKEMGEARLKLVVAIESKVYAMEEKLRSCQRYIEDHQAKVKAAEFDGSGECTYCHGVGACPRCWGRAGITRLEFLLKQCWLEMQWATAHLPVHPDAWMTAMHEVGAKVQHLK